MKGAILMQQLAVKNDTANALCDAAGLAAQLAVKKSTIRAWTRKTDMPRIQCGRLVRYDFSEVLAWLRSR